MSVAIPACSWAMAVSGAPHTSVLQCVAVCCIVLQCVAVGCSVKNVRIRAPKFQRARGQWQCPPRKTPMCVQVCCNVWHCVAVGCRGLQCVAV